MRPSRLPRSPATLSSHLFGGRNREKMDSGFQFFYFFFFLFAVSTIGSTMADAEEGRAAAAMLPESSPELRLLKLDETHLRRKLGSFQICALCTCCGGARGLCIPSPCCYAINCNIPNRPFGFCSFTPRTCNCFGCHL